MSGISEMDETVRQEYFELNKNLNRELWRIILNLPGQTAEIALSLPSLDNNIWVSYPQIQELIKSRMVESRWQSVCDLKESRTQNPKRSKAGVFAELCLQPFSKQFRPTYTPRSNDKNFEIVGITYSDLDPLEKLVSEGSRFWGPLPSWFSVDEKIKWVGVGRRRDQKASFCATLHSALAVIRSLLAFMLTIRTRVLFWREAKHTLRENLIFAALRKEIFRGVFGAPAFQATLLGRDFRVLLLRTNPRAVIFPRENQMWERSLSFECNKLGIPSAGVMHTTARFWDLRFFDLTPFSEYQPKFVVSNGQSSETLLRLGGLPDTSVIPGSALRFTHLNNFQDLGLQKKSNTRPTSVLVITGVNRNSAQSLIKLVESEKLFSDAKIRARPHPATIDWFLRGKKGIELERRSLESIVDEYDLFITESISSMALELAVANARVFVYAPRNELNFSPLAFFDCFSSYFQDQETLARLLGEDGQTLDIWPSLRVSASKADWEEILKEIVAHE